MTQEDLKLKVINAEAKVAKRTAVLKKHREQLAKLIQKGADKFDISIKQSDIESAVDKLEEARKTAEAAGLPFCERLAEGPDDELDPYTYDGSMSVEDYDAMQDTRSAREELAAVVTAQAPGLPAEKLDELAAAAAGLHISPETMQQILEAFGRVAEAVKEIARALMEAFKPIIDWAKKTAERFMEALAAGIVPRKWLHLAKHAKKAGTRKKYRNRIRRAVFAALAAEGGGSS